MKMSINKKLSTDVDSSGFSDSHNNIFNGMLWNLGDNGELQISGRGRIPDYYCGRNPEPPWEDRKDEIRTIRIMEGIEEVGIRAFSRCTNLQKVILPESLRRIHAYAFRDCRKLEKVVIPDNISLRFIYEEVEDKEDKSVLFFGIHSFYRTSWALKKWGIYYISKGVLFTCFSSEEHPELPLNVHRIGKFAFAYTDAKTLSLPFSITQIDDYAFTSSKLDYIYIPDSVEKIGDFAFTGSEPAFVSFPESWKQVKRILIDQLLHRSSDGEEDKLVKLPSCYEVALKVDQKYRPFKKIIIREKRRKQRGKDNGASSKCIYGIRSLFPGISLQKRIRHGSVLLGIGYSTTGVKCVTTYSWNKKWKYPEEYILQPCIGTDENQISAWKDIQFFLDEDYIDDCFKEIKNRDINNGNSVCTGLLMGEKEEWFWSDGKGFYTGHYYGGSLEIDLLELWMKQHPEMSIPSEQECWENDQDTCEE